MSLVAVDWSILLSFSSTNHITAVTTGSRLFSVLNPEAEDELLFFLSAKIRYCQFAMAASSLVSTNESQKKVSSAERPWHADYPSPKTAAASLSRRDLLQWFQEGRQAGKDFVLMGLRRTDFEV